MEFRYAVYRGLVWEICVLSINQGGPYSNLVVFQPKSSDFTSPVCNFYCILAGDLLFVATMTSLSLWWTAWDQPRLAKPLLYGWPVIPVYDDDAETIDGKLTSNW